MMNFARNFVALRKKKGFSQEQMAEKCGVSRSALAKWEVGNTVPYLHLVCNIAEIFEVSVDDLLRGKMNDLSDNTMEGVYEKLSEKLDEILSEVKGRGKTVDVYEQYRYRKGGSTLFDEDVPADIILQIGLDAASRGDYGEAEIYLEEALMLGEVSAVDTLMAIHGDILNMYACNQDDSEYWSYQLEVARKMQQYGKIVEEEIMSGRVF